MIRGRGRFWRRGGATIEQAATSVARAATANSLFSPGRNCWRVEHAERFRCVQDGAEYFHLVRDAILRARRTVFILGWDIAAGVDLEPQLENPGEPTKLVELLDFAVRRRPELECYVLIWDYAALYTMERDPFSRLKIGWRTHARVHFRFDDQHPWAGSHHQKVVVVDDKLAFSGGLDLTGHRWDTTEHPLEHPLRTNAIGEPYTPFHDVQALVEGPVAASLGELARERWRRCGVRKLPSVAPASENLWPADCEPDFRDIDVAISRTEPRFRGRPSVRECEALFYDSIASARRSIYIENQYFTNRALGRALAERLREPDGPEVIVLGPGECSGWLEQKTMGALRGAVLRELDAANLHGRLRLVHAQASREKCVDTFIHSKVTIVDDELLRIGSANFSNRSMGMDTECDLTLEAGGDPRREAEVRHVRDRLMAEHLGCSAAAVGEAVARLGSLRAALDELSTGDRRLAPIDVDAVPENSTWKPVLETADPAEPVAVTRALDRLLPEFEADSGRVGALTWLLPAFALLTPILAGARASDWRRWLQFSTHQQLLESAPNAEHVLWIAWIAVLTGGLLLVPLELMAFAAALLFGAWKGAWLALLGAVSSAAIGYALGRALGPRRIARWLGRPGYRLWSELRGRDVATVALLRLLSIASASVVHFLCGAARVPIRAYVLGTVSGLAPGIVTMCTMGALLRQVILEPTPMHGFVAASAALTLAVVVALVRKSLLLKQVRVASEAHSARALYG